MNVYKNIPKKQNGGFTLIELLVVIFILGILATLIISNLQGARQRARDASKKTELTNLKTALRLYYNDYQKYPEQDNGIYLPGCGPDGTTRCPDCASSYFAAGGVDGCQTVYMKTLGEVSDTFRYYQCDDDNFIAKVDLENLSDAGIAASQERCPADCGTTYSANEYIVCAD